MDILEGGEDVGRVEARVLRAEAAGLVFGGVGIVLVSGMELVDACTYTTCIEGHVLWCGGGRRGGHRCRPTALRPVLWWVMVGARTVQSINHMYQVSGNKRTRTLMTLTWTSSISM